MPAYIARPESLEAHRTDDGLTYLLRLDGAFLGELDAQLFDRLFKQLERRGLDGNGARELPGTPHDAIPPVDLVGAIAARTTAGDAPRPRTPRTQDEIDAILDETRKDMEQMTAAAAVKRDEIRRVPEGQSPGRGYRVCKHCRAANGVRAPKCIDCGKKL